MKRVLLVFEDFSEMSGLETSLRKMGFDVVALSNEILIPYQILRFNPDIIVAYGNSKRVSSLSVGKKLRDGQRFVGKSILVFNPDHAPLPSELKEVKMDSTLTGPLTIQKLILALGKVSGFNAEAMLEKYHKYGFTGEVVPQTIRVAQLKGAAQDTTPVLDRDERYKRLTQGLRLDAKETSFVKKEVKQHQDELRQGWSEEALEELDGLKRQFVDALFKVKK